MWSGFRTTTCYYPVVGQDNTLPLVRRADFRRAEYADERLAYYLPRTSDFSNRLRTYLIQRDPFILLDRSPSTFSMKTSPHFGHSFDEYVKESAIRTRPCVCRRDYGLTRHSATLYPFNPRNFRYGTVVTLQNRAGSISPVPFSDQICHLGTHPSQRKRLCEFSASADEIPFSSPHIR